MLKRLAIYSVFTFSISTLLPSYFYLEVRSEDVSKELEPTEDTLEQVKKNIEAGKAVLVDVRSEEETKKGYLQGAVLLPVQELTQSPDKKKIRKAIDEGKIVYTYCVVGKRALVGGKALKELGYDARPLKPGYKELIEAGFKNAE